MWQNLRRCYRSRNRSTPRCRQCGDGARPGRTPPCRRIRCRYRNRRPRCGQETRYLAFTAPPNQLIGVVVGIGHLHVVDLRSRSHRTERDGIDLLVLLEGIAGELATHVTQGTRTVGIVAASVRSAGTALDLHGPLVVHTATAENDTAPSPGQQLPDGISEVKTIGSLCVPLAHNWPPGSTMSAALVSLSPLIIVPEPA